MNDLEATNARINDDPKSVARAERYKKEADNEVKYYREALAEARKTVATLETHLKASIERAKVARKELEDARVG
jgi:soluble cytochrome b562